MGPYHACSSPHLERDCNESIYNRCRPNLDNPTPAKCIRKRPPNSQLNSNLPIIITALEVNLMVTVTQIFNYQFPPVNQTTLLKSTKKMTRYFKKTYKYNKTHHSSTDSHHCSTSDYNTTHSDKHKFKSHNSNDEVNEIIDQRHASKTIETEPENIKDPHDSESPDCNIFSSSNSE